MHPLNLCTALASFISVSLLFAVVVFNHKMTICAMQIAEPAVRHLAEPRNVTLCIHPASPMLGFQQLHWGAGRALPGKRGVTHPSLHHPAWPLPAFLEASRVGTALSRRDKRFWLLQACPFWGFFVINTHSNI